MKSSAHWQTWRPRTETSSDQETHPETGLEGPYQFSNVYGVLEQSWWFGLGECGLAYSIPIGLAPPRALGPSCASLCIRHGALKWTGHPVLQSVKAFSTTNTEECPPFKCHEPWQTDPVTTTWWLTSFSSLSSGTQSRMFQTHKTEHKEAQIERLFYPPALGMLCSHCGSMAGQQSLVETFKGSRAWKLWPERWSDQNIHCYCSLSVVTADISAAEPNSWAIQFPNQWVTGALIFL